MDSISRYCWILHVNFVSNCFRSVEKIIRDWVVTRNWNHETSKSSRSPLIDEAPERDRKEERLYPRWNEIDINSYIRWSASWNPLWARVTRGHYLLTPHNFAVGLGNILVGSDFHFGDDPLSCEPWIALDYGNHSLLPGRIQLHASQKGLTLRQTVPFIAKAL
jgi:hypothetical protein